MSHQEHPGRRFTALLLTATAAAVALYSLGSLPYLQVPWNDLQGWIHRAPLEEVIPALVRLPAMLAAVWLAASSLLYLLARLGHVASATTVMRCTTPPAVRRLADRMVAGSLLLSTLAAPISAAARSASPPAAPAAEVVAGDYLPALPASEKAPVVGRPLETLVTPPPADVASLTAPRASRLEVVIAPGDNLWQLAERRLGETSHPAPSSAEIAAYWRRVVEENRRRIRSGDPDLIYPGEVVVLPPPPPVTQGGS